MDMYDRINGLLEEKSMTKRYLAKETGIPYNTLMSLFSRRSKNMDLKAAKKIANCLNTTLEYLIAGQTKPDQTEHLIIPEKYKDVMVAFSGGTDNLTQEDINDIIHFIEFKKSRK